MLKLQGLRFIQKDGRMKKLRKQEKSGEKIKEGLEEIQS